MQICKTEQNGSVNRSTLAPLNNSAVSVALSINVHNSSLRGQCSLIFTVTQKLIYFILTSKCWYEWIIMGWEHRVGIVFNVLEGAVNIYSGVLLPEYFWLLFSHLFLSELSLLPTEIRVSSCSVAIVQRPPAPHIQKQHVEAQEQRTEKFGLYLGLICPVSV